MEKKKNRDEIEKFLNSTCISQLLDQVTFQNFKINYWKLLNDMITATVRKEKCPYSMPSFTLTKDGIWCNSRQLKIAVTFWF